MSAKTKWIVQAFVPGGGFRHRWEDVPNPDVHPRYPDTGPWEAEDAGGAFFLAVVKNPEHRIEGVSYRVLPHTGGATFNVSVNVDATEHDQADLPTPEESVN